MTDSSNKDMDEENFQWVLDELPVGISVQTPTREILYENETVKDLIGSYLHRQCYSRWHYLPDRGEKPCPDCPASIGMQDNKGHKVFRKTLDDKGNDLYLEIEFVPITDSEGKLEKFIEFKVPNESEIKEIITNKDNIVSETQSKIADTQKKLKLKLHLLERVIGSKEKIQVEAIKQGEPLMINVNSAVTLGVVTNLKKDDVNIPSRNSSVSSIC